MATLNVTVIAMRDIGKNIRTLRIRRGLTQDELAEAMFVTRQTVSNYRDRPLPPGCGNASEHCPGSGGGYPPSSLRSSGGGSPAPGKRKTFDGRHRSDPLDDFAGRARADLGGGNRAPWRFLLLLAAESDGLAGADADSRLGGHAGRGPALSSAPRRQALDKGCPASRLCWDIPGCSCDDWNLSERPSGAIYRQSDENRPSHRQSDTSGSRHGFGEEKRLSWFFWVASCGIWASQREELEIRTPTGAGLYGRPEPGALFCALPPNANQSLP